MTTIPAALKDLLAENARLRVEKQHLTDVLHAAEGEIDRLKELMARSNRLGMKTFDQSLFELYEARHLCYEEALRNADSKNELRLRIKLESCRNKDFIESTQNLTLLAEEPDHA
jgi:twitching motility protein PilU